MVDHTIMHPEVKRELDNGKAYLPIPEGQKFPPPSGTTGNRPMATNDEIRALWVGVSGSSNVAWWLPNNVICIDVDHYGEKTGADTLKELEMELGKFGAWSTTRHGAGSKSRKYFLTVPEGIKWHGKAGAGIDILQMTHRYAIVAPSVVDGLAEQWYRPDGTPSDHAPLMEELTALPEKWVEHLKRSNTLDFKNAPSEDLSWDDADVWLSKVAPGWEAEPGPIFRSILEDEELFSDNGHDTMVSKQKHFLRLAVVDGQSGLGKAMAEMERLFIEEVSTREGKDRRGEETAEREFKSALYSEVDNLRGDIEHKKAVPFLVKYSPSAAPGFTSLTGAAEAAKAHEDLLKSARRALWSSKSDALASELLQLLHPDWVAGLATDIDARIYDQSAHKVLGESEVSSALSDGVKGLLDTLDLEEQAINDDPKDNPALKAIRTAKDYCDKSSNAAGAMKKTAAMLSKAGRSIQLDQLDRKVDLVGLPDGRGLDLQKILAGKSITDDGVMRPLEASDLVTKFWDVELEDGLAVLEQMNERGLQTGNERLVRAMCTNERGQFIQERYDVLQMELGYAALWGNNRLNRLLVLWGPRGDNGKNALLESLKAIGKRGGYVDKIGMGALLKTQEGANQELAERLTHRLVVVDELTGDYLKAINKLKEITGGSGAVTRRMYGAMEHSDTLTPILMTNVAPKMKVKNPEIRRFRVVKLEGLGKDIKAAMPPIEQAWRDRPEEGVWLFLWLLEGLCKAFEANTANTPMPAIVQQDTMEFLGEADPLRSWLFDTVEVTGDPADCLTAGELKRRAARPDEYGELNNADLADLKAYLSQAGATTTTRTGGALKVTGSDGKRSLGYKGVRFLEASEEDPYPVTTLNLVRGKQKAG